ncbi:hypothetical protein MHYP_G00179070 [Metynnis hypsauchen]
MLTKGVHAGGEEAGQLFLASCEKAACSPVLTAKDTEWTIGISTPPSVLSLAAQRPRSGQYQGGGEQKVEEEEGSDSIHLRQAVITSGPVTGIQLTNQRSLSSVLGPWTGAGRPLSHLMMTHCHCHCHIDVRPLQTMTLEQNELDYGILGFS